MSISTIILISFSLGNVFLLLKQNLLSPSSLEHCFYLVLLHLQSFPQRKSPPSKLYPVLSLCLWKCSYHFQQQQQMMLTWPLKHWASDKLFITQFIKTSQQNSLSACSYLPCLCATEIWLLTGHFLSTAPGDA